MALRIGATAPDFGAETTQGNIRRQLYDMMPEDAGESCEGRSAADNQTVRTYT